MEISSFTDRILQYLHIIKCPVNPPLIPCCPCLRTRRTSPLARGGEFPFTLVPGLLITTPPFISPSTPSHPTHGSSYNVYIDDISNTIVLVWHSYIGEAWSGGNKSELLTLLHDFFNCPLKKRGSEKWMTHPSCMSPHFFTLLFSCAKIATLFGMWGASAECTRSMLG